MSIQRCALVVLLRVTNPDALAQEAGRTPGPVLTGLEKVKALTPTGA
jgi:hypothetical protein